LNIQTAEYIHSAHSARELLHDGRPEVAFVGRSNVGKSSLLNALIGTKPGRKGLAKTSSTPGRTQTINYFLINDSLWFVDLPGYGYAKTSKDKRQAWAKTVEHYFERALPAATAVLLIDAKVGGTPLDAAAWEYLTGNGAQPVVVATKVDKVPRGKRHQARVALRERVGLPEGYPVAEVSVSTGEGIRELMREITARLQESLARSQPEHA
jgi:GTP-binding protein